MERPFRKELNRNNNKPNRQYPTTDNPRKLATPLRSASRSKKPLKINMIIAGA
jgi:hypothetical protein